MTQCSRTKTRRWKRLPVDRPAWGSGANVTAQWDNVNLIIQRSWWHVFLPYGKKKKCTTGKMEIKMPEFFTSRLQISNVVGGIQFQVGTNFNGPQSFFPFWIATGGKRQQRDRLFGEKRLGFSFSGRGSKVHANGAVVCPQLTGSGPPLPRFLPFLLSPRSLRFLFPFLSLSLFYLRLEYGSSSFPGTWTHRQTHTEYLVALAFIISFLNVFGLRSEWTLHKFIKPGRQRTNCWRQGRLFRFFGYFLKTCNFIIFFLQWE